MRAIAVLISILMFAQFSFSNESLPEPGITLPGFGTPIFCLALNEDRAFQLNKVAEGSLKSPETGDVYQILGGSQSSGVLNLRGIVESPLEDPAAKMTWAMTDMVQKGQTENGAELYTGQLDLEFYAFGVATSLTFEVHCQYEN